MIQANEQAIRQVVQEVLAQLGKRGGTAPRGENGHANGDWGVFRTVDDAVAFSGNGTVPSDWLGSAPKVMVWLAGVTVKLCGTAVAAV